MPTYEYVCKNCGHEMEELQSMSEPPLTLCPRCKSDGLARVLGGGGGLIFKGSGFYLTDYKKEQKTTSPVKKAEKKEDRQEEKKETPPAGGKETPKPEAPKTPDKGS